MSSSACTIRRIPASFIPQIQCGLENLFYPLRLIFHRAARIGGSILSFSPRQNDEASPSHIFRKKRCTTEVARQCQQRAVRGVAWPRSARRNCLQFSSRLHKYDCCTWHWRRLSTVPLNRTISIGIWDGSWWCGAGWFRMDATQQSRIIGKGVQLLISMCCVTKDEPAPGGPVLGDGDIKGCLPHLASKRDVVHCVGDRRVPCFVRSPHALSGLKATASYLPLLRVNGSFLRSCISSSSTARWSNSECAPGPRSLPSLPVRQSCRLETSRRKFLTRSSMVQRVCSCVSRMVTTTCSQPCQKCSGSTKSHSLSTVQKQANLSKFGTSRRLGTTRNRSSKHQLIHTVCHLNFLMGLGATSSLSAIVTWMQSPRRNCTLNATSSTGKRCSRTAHCTQRRSHKPSLWMRKPSICAHRDVLRRRCHETLTAADKFHASYL